MHKITWFRKDQRSIVITATVIVVVAVFVVSALFYTMDGNKLCEAIQNGNDDQLVKLLEDGADANSPTHTIFYLPVSVILDSDYPTTPLETACQNGNTFAVKKLLEHGADPNKRIAGGFSSIGAVYSTSKGRAVRFEIIPLLVERGAAVDDIGKSINGRHAAFREAGLAEDKSAQQSIRLLELYTNEPADLRNHRGETLLMVCACPVVCDWLIQNGADVNAADNDGNTPLMHSVISENVKVIEILIENGANIEVKNAEGKTAYELAQEQGVSEDLLTLLRP